MPTASPPEEPPPLPARPAHPETETVSMVHGYQARKRYVCPGCGGPIKVGEGHLVVVPDNPDLRRHWHGACWAAERRRRGH